MIASLSVLVNKLSDREHLSIITIVTVVFAAALYLGGQKISNDVNNFNQDYNLKLLQIETLKRIVTEIQKMKIAGAGVFAAGADDFAAELQQLLQQYTIQATLAVQDGGFIIISGQTTKAEQFSRMLSDFTQKGGNVMSFSLQRDKRNMRFSAQLQR